MPAAIGSCVDLPNVAAAADGGNHFVGVCAFPAGTVDFLRLVLPRNGSGIFVAFPNSAFQPYRRCGGYRLGYCLPIVVIFLRLGKQKHIFIAARRSVPRAFRHGVSLVPNDRTAQIPTVAPQGKGYKPRNTD